MDVQLRGLTWDDPRGYGPLKRFDEYLALSPAGEEISVLWDTQPLSGFESAPLDRLAERYDLLVIDHPHVGDAARLGVLTPLTDAVDDFVGPTFTSYQWEGQQWAMPIDAACHVSACRKEIHFDTPPTLADLPRAAASGLRISLPLHGVHSLMALLTLLASSGAAMDEPSELPPDECLGEAARKLAQLAQIAHPDSLSWNPIQALDAIAHNACDYVPLTFGYSHFQRGGARFSFIPIVDEHHKLRPILGGTGIAISANCSHMDAARYCVQVMTDSRIQTTHWAKNGGQPAHRNAWDALADNDEFYRQTRASIEAAYVRPRRPCWTHFQTVAGDAINRWLREGARDPVWLCEALRRRWWEIF